MTEVTLAILWWLTAAGQFHKYAGAPGLILSFLFSLAIVHAYFRWKPALARGVDRFSTGRFGAHRIPLALSLCAVAAFAIFYPIAHAHVLGPGSDRGDALDRGISAIVAGHNPYAHPTFLGNAIDVLPGAFLLGLPFHLMGTAALQNLFWLVALILLMPRWCASRLDALAFSVFILINPGVMQDYVTGGDYITNAIVVLVATRLAFNALGQGRISLRAAGALAFFGLAIATRPIYLVAPIAVGIRLFKERGPRAGVLFGLAVGAILLMLTLPFYLHDPANFGPLNALGKASTIPHAIWILVPASLLSIMLMFVVDAEWSRLVLICGVALGILIVPPVIGGIVEHRIAADPFAFPVLLFVGTGLLAMAPEAAPVAQ
jgi:hypothetical protein